MGTPSVTIKVAHADIQSFMDDNEVVGLTRKRRFSLTPEFKNGNLLISGSRTDFEKSFEEYLFIGDIANTFRTAASEFDTHTRRKRQVTHVPGKRNIDIIFTRNDR